MITPTQAQREATKQLVNQLDQLLMQNRYNEAEFVVARALTAASQVGEPEYLYDKQKRTLSKYAQVVNATIERCAQAVEMCGVTDDPRLQAIAAAIRKLKDEP